MLAVDNNEEEEEEEEEEEGGTKRNASVLLGERPWTMIEF